MTTIELKEQDREINVQADRVITDDAVQKRYYIAELVKKALNQYLDYDSLYADNTYSIYTLPLINEVTDFIDFDINSLSVHVVPTIDKSKNRSVYIPKAYQIYNCKPDIIVFVDFNAALTKMSIVGFIKDVKLSELTLSKAALLPADDLIMILKTMRSRRSEDNENVVDVANELMLAYVDSSLSEEGEYFFLKNLVSNKTIRKNYKLFYGLNSKFVCVAKRHRALPDDNFVPVDSLPIEEEFDMVTHPDNIQTEQPVSADCVDGLNLSIEDFEDTTGEEQEKTSVDELLLDSEESVSLLDAGIDDGNILQESGQEDEQTSLDEETIEINDDISMQNNISDSEDEFTELDFTDYDGDEPLSLDTLDGELSLQEENVESISDNSLSDADNIPISAEANEPEELFSDITQEANTSVDIEGLAQDNTIQLQENNVDPVASEAEELSVENDKESGDDLFSFLSEMADEVKEENTEQQPAEGQLVEEHSLEQVSEQDVEEPVDTPEYQEDDNQASVDEYTQQTQSMLNGDGLNDAFATQDAEEQSQQTFEMENQTQTEQKTVVSMPLVAALAMLLIAGGVYGVYSNKDKIPFLNNSSEIQDLALDNKATTEELPAPIDDLSKVDTDMPTKNDAQAVAPAPSSPDVAAAPGAQGVTPPTPVDAKSAPTLPSLPTAVEPPRPKHLNDAIATALTKDFSGVRISKVSWEVSETLLNNSDVKTYLTIAGKSVKNALAQDLMAATEPSFKDTVAVNVIYRKDGGVSQVRIVSSSGSNQIDEMIVKSVKNTLNYIKMPALNLDKPEYTAKLIVRL